MSMTYLMYPEPNGHFTYIPAPTVDLSRFPHRCPRCGGAAYLGAVPAAAECSVATCALAPARRWILG